MRGMVSELTTAVPLITRLPAVYQDEDFVRRFVAAFDDALAPVVLTLDGLPDYFDPRLAPADFLAWVAEWLGIELDDDWPIDQRREIVQGAARLHRRRGTIPGVVDAVRLGLGLGPVGAGAQGAGVEVADSGGTRWSTTPGAELPGSRRPALTVRVTMPEPHTADRRRLERVVAAAKPAHVPHTVVVVAGRTDPNGDLAPSTAIGAGGAAAPTPGPAAAPDGPAHREDTC